MLLRNLNPLIGLCNGTRMVCKKFDKNVIYAEITTGQHASEKVLLPKFFLNQQKIKIIHLNLHTNNFRFDFFLDDSD